jgi:hypothetical protein
LPGGFGDQGGSNFAELEDEEEESPITFFLPEAMENRQWIHNVD